MDRSWTGYTTVLISTLLGSCLFLFGFVALLDPYDDVPFSPPMARPPMDVNQRFMYPAIIRRGVYDSVVFGTSTARLLEPAKLDSALGGRFANLAMNSATAYEQYRLADLFLRKTAHPKTLLLGLDHVWCNEDADRVRFTGRPFPPWLYDDDPWNDLPYLLNGTTLEIAGRLALFQLGLAKPRLGWDGYERFVPPEESYDLERARSHIYPGKERYRSVQSPAVLVDSETRTAMRFPALDWLEDLLSRSPESAQKLLVFMPIHVMAQPAPGSLAAARETECKARVAAIAQRRGLIVIDFRIDSPLTRNDENFWDPLHYRVPIADEIVRQIAKAARERRDDPNGVYRILND